jgi:hypothetical protein
MSLISPIIIDYFFGDSIILWFENNWYYLLGGFLLITLIVAFIDHLKNPTNK